MRYNRRALRKVRVDIRSVGIAFHAIHSLRHAQRGFGVIFQRAAAGVPQAIRTPDRRFVIIISASAYVAMARIACRPKSATTNTATETIP